uniref:Uncharacterized protein n=1 Tax=Strigamia maritima TaxID=126957 RepID=T1JFZ0_STRMM
MASPLRFGAMMCIILTGIFTIHFFTLFATYTGIYHRQRRFLTPLPSGQNSTHVISILKHGIVVYSVKTGLCIISFISLLLGLLLNNITLITIWLFVVTLKMLALTSILIAATVVATIYPVPFFWPYAEFPFVIFWGVLWVVVFLYNLELRYEIYPYYLGKNGMLDNGKSEQGDRIIQVQNSPK